MTSAVHLPPHQAPDGGDPPSGRPADGTAPRSRRWLLGVWAVVFVAFLAVSPGRMTFDTKLGVVVDPGRFLGDLGELWHSRNGFGGIADQYIGYLVPMLPYYGLAELTKVPTWLAERLWLSLIVATAFWGALRLAERLRVGSSATRLLGALVYALWPTYTIVIGSTSAAALPGAMLPWVLLPLTDPRLAPRVAAARSALLIPLMGGVNAASTLASLLPVGLYLLSRPGGPRKRALLLWWIPGVILATAWWIVPLLLLGVFGENFMPYVESSFTTTTTMSAAEVLRGAGNWVGYLNFGEAWLPAGWTVVTGTVTILGSALAAALGLAGLARRDLPERRWLVLTVLSVALVTLAGYGGALGGLFHGTVQEWLDTWLVPFRNIYKFQTGLALALALGLAHITAVLALRLGQSGQDGRVPVRARRLAPVIAAVLVLPGLAWPYVNGSILQPGSFKEIPDHWAKAADWLKKNSPDDRALVVPATAHGIYAWGSTIDQPLDVLADTPYAQRDYVPFGTPGNRRAMDAVEQALTSGGQVPGLSEFLNRAGLHYVVVRNDLDPDQLGYVPTTTVKRTLEASGYKRVMSEGPVMTGGRIADGTPVQIEGLYPRQEAVEIYEPPTGTERPGRATAVPVSSTAVVSGGPESLLPLAAAGVLEGRPTVLAGDAHPGVGKPSLYAAGDGLRRADTRFGLVNTNTSHTYTADERNAPEAEQDPGAQPRQILPTEGKEHQTTAVLRGAKSVTASSIGNWLFHLPQYDPVNAFDGNPDTAWAEGSAASPKGEWVRIDFSGTQEIPASLQLTPLPGNGVRAAATEVRVETDRGHKDSPVRPDGSLQQVAAPEGPAQWLKVTILKSQQGRPGLTGAGFSDIAIPGVQVTRMLELPADAPREGADASVYALKRGSDPGGLSAVAAETGLHRQFTTGQAGEYTVAASAVPVPGDALDKLLFELTGKRNQILVTADSTARLGTNLTARNLTDGDLTTAWIAGDRPVLRLSWPKATEVGEIVFAAAGGISARPEQVQISSPDGTAVAAVDENGMARFSPITTDKMDITISRTAPLTVHNPFADDQLQLPVGLSEVYIPALDKFRSPQPDPEKEFSLPCGKGPVLAIGGTLMETRAEGRIADLTQRRPIAVSLCSEQSKVELGASTHTVEAGDAGPLAITDVTLSSGETKAPAATARTVDVKESEGDRRTLTIGAGEASYLQLHENHNKGWKATLDGKELTPLRIDGWQQAWLVPEGEGGTVTLEYGPARIYQAGLIGAAVLFLVLVGLAFGRRRDSDGAEGAYEGTDQPVPPGPGLILGTVALTLVGIVIAGPVALVVPVLAVLAHFRPSWLAPVAFASMAAAGVVVAIGTGEYTARGEGAFGATAQLLALIALFAALVTVGAPGRGRRAAGRSPEPSAVAAGGGDTEATIPQQAVPSSGRTLSADARKPDGTGTGSGTGKPHLGKERTDPPTRGPGSPGSPASPSDGGGPNG
ncbi:alpha-(1-_3)-arabinofuranosyltransferase family protein [Streptomyces sp. DvalAA-19]|uniref:alpha-(1->3)-arabinofuranosyltransferase domain-containing protein n=1 Tax=Streptomyces sp. DvalAA-19 TaxID=1839761 RepID=UPI00081B50E7|nr:alpha-(1->3)-arabinofuranosyltransferase family protein [Streptomyces sp. DvalAA-19]SCD39891.1 arabinofuranan 3-O-arabinosyltransferase [Streptomyces sp. DvalAA-19]